MPTITVKIANHQDGKCYAELRGPGGLVTFVVKDKHLSTPDAQGLEAHIKKMLGL